MSAYVVVQLTTQKHAKRMGGEHGALTHHKVKRLLTEHGAEVISSQESKDAAREASATISVPDMARADKLAAALREMDGIETAYAKPAEELP